MREISEQDSLRKLIDGLTQKITDDIQDFDNMTSEINKLLEKTGWIEGLPKAESKMPTVATVDGGSRHYNTRGASIIFAQAAGRVMGEGSKRNKWLITRRALMSKGTLARDLASLLRQRLELSIATQLMIEYRPKYFMFDGVLNGIYRVGVPERIHKAIEKGKEEEMSSIVKDYLDELVFYGEQLHEFLNVITETGTRVIGLPKDSYSTRFVDESLGISDSTFFSIASKGNPGYSKEFTFEAQDNLRKSVLWEHWKEKGIDIPTKYNNVSVFYVNIRKNGIPIRVDQFKEIFESPEILLPDLLSFSDDKDWFFPPRLAHEKAVVKQDVFDAFYRGLYNAVNDISPSYAKYILGETRRSRTQ